MAEHLTSEYDVLVAGGGITGLTLACSLKQAGLRIGVIELREPPALEKDYNLRVSAINRASLKVFDRIGAFERMQQLRVSPFRQMHVWDSTGVGQIHFDSAELGLDTLGYIIENNVIQRALLDVAQQAESIDWICPGAIESLDLSEELKHVQLAGGRTLTAPLLVGADGANSVVRGAMGSELVRKSYRQQAIVCTVATEQDHQQTAWQCFLPTGPLAFLPLANRCCSIVWSLDEASVEQMMALDDEAFSTRLAEAFEYQLGSATLVSARAVFPLGHGHVDRYVEPGLALIGDAAHNIHPLAGQGANLGIMDAACLAEVISAALQQHRQWHALHTLRKYERRRKGDNRLMETTMTGFKSLFGNANPVFTELRNIGLNIVDHTAAVKKLFIKQALGEY